MNKSLKNNLLVLLIIIILFAILWFYYDTYKEKPVDANIENTNLTDENTGLDNVINDLFDDVVTNKESTNTVVNEEIKNNEVEEDENKDENENQNEENITSTETVTSKEERAIELVKDEWGTTTGVYFSNMGIDNQGRYIVSVNKKDTTVLAWYLVDVNTGLVTKK